MKLFNQSSFPKAFPFPNFSHRLPISLPLAFWKWCILCKMMQKARKWQENSQPFQARVPRSTQAPPKPAVTQGIPEVRLESGCQSLKFERIWAIYVIPEVSAFKTIQSLGQQIWRRPMACVWESSCRSQFLFTCQFQWIRKLTCSTVTSSSYGNMQHCPLSSLARDMMILMMNRPSRVSTHEKDLILIDFDICKHSWVSVKSLRNDTHRKVKPFKQLLQGKGPKWFGLDRKDDACSTSRCRGPTGRKKADLVRSHGGLNYVLNMLSKVLGLEFEEKDSRHFKTWTWGWAKCALTWNISPNWSEMRS